MKPSQAVILAEKHGVSLPVRLGLEHYSFSHFDDFLSLYDQVGHVVRSAEDLRYIAFTYLEEVARAGSIYVELMLSPGHSIANGIPFLSQVSAISDAIEEAETKFGILSSIILTCVRHRGPDEAVTVAEMAASAGSRHVRGFGLTGNERAFDAKDFQGAFLIAENSGLGLTAHTGEWLSAESVLHTVNTLNLNRVGHGISVAESSDVASELAERSIGFEICMSSNIILGAAQSYDTHPVRKLIDAGCRVAFSTDDPAYFRTSPDREIELGRKHVRLTESEQWQVIDDSIDMAFCDEAMKSKLRLSCEGYGEGSTTDCFGPEGSIPVGTGSA
jgi:adenosine deaminase